jgi:hypothetical protein
MPRVPMPQIPGPARFIAGVFGVVFGGVGICLLFLMWGGEADFTPVPMRMFGSLIALAFVAFGGVMVFSVFKSNAMGSIELPDVSDASPGAPLPPPSSSPAGYVCPRCGAALGTKADVSPMGDVKCPFCAQWFNVHRRE